MIKILFYLFCLLPLAALAQDEIDSQSILEKSAQKMNGYKTIVTDFKVSTTQAQTKETQLESGKAWLKGEKYHLDFSKAKVFFDGKNIYTYSPKSNEANITKPEPAKNVKGNIFLSNPRDIFKIYNKNFKSKFIKETEVGKRLCYEIDLIPSDLKSQYLNLKMHIEKSSLHVVDVRINMKDGVRQYIEFSNLTPNADISDALFKFDERKFPGVQINDMRF
jgi:outer membrane lipoprotein carrier protein